MSWRGDFAPSSIIDFKFTTRRFSTGAPFTLAGTPAVSVYKDNSTTQSTSGVTLTVDFDTVTGLNHVRIDTSADGTFYSAGSNFQVVITAGTVDSVSVVGEAVGEFSLNNRSALRPTTAGRTLTVESDGMAHADVKEWKGSAPADLASTLVQASVGAMQAAALADFFDTDSGTNYAAAVAGSVVKETADNAGGASLTEAGIADAVWDEARSGHVAAGSFGEGVASVQGNVTGSVASVTNKVTPIDIDGKTFEVVMRAIRAGVIGVATPNGANTIDFKGDDGTTTRLRIVYGASSGERTSSAIDP